MNAIESGFDVELKPFAKMEIGVGNNFNNPAGYVQAMFCDRPTPSMLGYQAGEKGDWRILQLHTHEDSSKNSVTIGFFPS